ncbi:MAG TPA: sigma-54 dependent transcriptional regulator, partial [Planctomycetaceae bacterium]|jgi:two-component system nitrogen regulation response regulator GlnG|nr:sigma-54 dependent transcriptional regulator [Planctomycetaceae bacterium]
MQRGAFDYVLKPWDLEELTDLVNKALATGRMSHVPARIEPASGGDDRVDRVIGRSPAMQSVFKEIGRIAGQNVTVLILGESGTGKELAARAIYDYSRRSDQPFLAINCAAIPEPLLESELFGHEKGAFTGAERLRIGKFEQAHRGTLFLDEIGDAALATQAKILRVLQDGKFERVGGNETIQVDVRILAATSRDLDQAMQQKEFRPDLYFRLNTFTLRLPPLRDRADDIPLLAEYFLQRFRRELGVDVQGISPESLDLLRRYHWPGNVRELESALKYALVHSRGDLVTPQALPGSVRGHADGTLPEPTQAEDGNLADVRSLVRNLLSTGTTRLSETVHAAVDRVLLEQVLASVGGHQARAAEILGLSRNTLRTRLQQLGLTVEKVVQDESDAAH